MKGSMLVLTIGILLLCAVPRVAAQAVAELPPPPMPGSPAFQYNQDLEKYLDAEYDKVYGRSLYGDQGALDPNDQGIAAPPGEPLPRDIARSGKVPLQDPEQLLRDPRRAPINESTVKGLILRRDGYAAALENAADRLDEKLNQSPAKKRAYIAELYDKSKQIRALENEYRGKIYDLNIPLLREQLNTASYNAEAYGRARTQYDEATKEAQRLENELNEKKAEYFKENPELLIQGEGVLYDFLYQALLNDEGETPQLQEVHRTEVFNEYAKKGSADARAEASKVRDYTIEELHELGHPRFDPIGDAYAAAGRQKGSRRKHDYNEEVKGHYKSYEAWTKADEAFSNLVLLAVQIIAIPLGPAVCLGAALVEVTIDGGKAYVRYLDAEEAAAAPPADGINKFHHMITAREKAAAAAGQAIFTVFTLSFDIADVVYAGKAAGAATDACPKPVPQTPETPPAVAVAGDAPPRPITGGRAPAPSADDLPSGAPVPGDGGPPHLVTGGDAPPPAAPDADTVLNPGRERGPNDTNPDAPSPGPDDDLPPPSRTGDGDEGPPTGAADAPPGADDFEVMPLEEYKETVEMLVHLNRGGLTPRDIERLHARVQADPDYIENLPNRGRLEPSEGEPQPAMSVEDARRLREEYERRIAEAGAPGDQAAAQAGLDESSADIVIDDPLPPPNPAPGDVARRAEMDTDGRVATPREPRPGDTVEVPPEDVARELERGRERAEMETVVVVPPEDVARELERARRAEMETDGRVGTPREPDTPAEPNGRTGPGDTEVIPVIPKEDIQRALDEGRAEDAVRERAEMDTDGRVATPREPERRTGPGDTEVIPVIPKEDIQRALDEGRAEDAVRDRAEMETEGRRQTGDDEPDTPAGPDEDTIVEPDTPAGPDDDTVVMRPDEEDAADAARARRRGEEPDTPAGPDDDTIVMRPGEAEAEDAADAARARRGGEEPDTPAGPDDDTIVMRPGEAEAEDAADAARAERAEAETDGGVRAGEEERRPGDAQADESRQPSRIGPALRTVRKAAGEVVENVIKDQIGEVEEKPTAGEGRRPETPRGEPAAGVDDTAGRGEQAEVPVPVPSLPGEEGAPGEVTPDEPPPAGAGGGVRAAEAADVPRPDEREQPDNLEEPSEVTPEGPPAREDRRVSDAGRDAPDGQQVAVVPDELLHRIEPITYSMGPVDGGDETGIDLTTQTFTTINISTLVTAGRDPAVQIVIMSGPAIQSGGTPTHERAPTEGQPTGTSLIGSEELVPGGGIVFYDPDLKVFLQGLGTLGNDAIEMKIFGTDPNSPVQITAEGLVVEPVKLEEEAKKQLEQQLHRLAAQNPITAKIDAYCLEFLRQPPDLGTVFRIADQEIQQRFASLGKVLSTGRRLHEMGLLNPDSDPEEYFHSIRQWALWSVQENLDLGKFGDAFVEHTRKNFEAAGEPWTDQVESFVRELIPNRWRDIARIVDEARGTGESSSETAEEPSR
jgi:hypothetical protein